MNDNTNKNQRIGVCGILMLDKKIVVIKKARGPYKGKYDLPGGKIEEGESHEEALKREFLEETGLTISVDKFIDTNEVHSKYLNDKGEDRELYHTGYFYFVSLVSGDLKVEADGEDSLGAVWLDIDSLNEDNTSKISFGVLKKYLTI